MPEPSNLNAPDTEPVNPLRRDKRRARELQRTSRAAQTAGTAVGTGMEVGGAAMQAVGKGTTIAGKGVSAAGRAGMSAGARASSTGVGAVVGVPLMAAGTVGTAGGAGMQAVGRGVDATGKGLRNAGKNVRRGSTIAGGSAAVGSALPNRIGPPPATEVRANMQQASAMQGMSKKIGAAATKVLGENAGGKVAGAVADEAFDRLGFSLFWSPLYTMVGFYLVLLAPIVIPLTLFYLLLGTFGIPGFKASLIKWLVWGCLAIFSAAVWLGVTALFMGIILAVKDAADCAVDVFCTIGQFYNLIF